MIYQVTFSDDQHSTRLFEEVGKYDSIEAARAAAKTRVEAYFGIPMVNDQKRLHIEIEQDAAYVGPCEDWFVASLGKASKAVIVAINALPLTLKGNSQRETRNVSAPV